MFKNSVMVFIRSCLRSGDSYFSLIFLLKIGLESLFSSEYFLKFLCTEEERLRLAPCDRFFLWEKSDWSLRNEIGLWSTPCGLKLLEESLLNLLLTISPNSTPCDACLARFLFPLFPPFFIDFFPLNSPLNSSFSDSISDKSPIKFFNFPVSLLPLSDPELDSSPFRFFLLLGSDWKRFLFESSKMSLFRVAAYIEESSSNFESSLLVSTFAVFRLVFFFFLLVRDIFLIINSFDRDPSGNSGSASS
mmetsp:Transcript_3865/g.3656  ORF Transcript_3865/g.3656 Transcript_3865/m.3656 type:complete len:247 (-) Transcript_3865:19-759(-)